MEKTLLTKVVTQLVNERANAQEYGVALVNIPDFDYVAFALGLSSERKAALFFLGFPESTRARIESELSQNERLSYDFTVEKAEESRNSGDESIFRVLVIKRAEMEKMSSLRWFPEITLERIYTKSCDLAKKDLAGTNAVIEALIQALRSKPIRSILSFERVLEYLELLISSPADTLPDAIKENYYRLGLCADKNVDSRNPVRDDFVARIKHNHGIVERISNLEQAERQSITNYYTKATGKKETPHRILSYYKTKDIALLGQMELLAPTQSKNARTQFALFAIPYKKNYILLNTSMANRTVADSIKGRRFSFLGRRGTIYTEHYVGGYKSDIYIQDTNTIIEVKSVLSTEKCALFPTVFSERALKQLEKLRDLLSLGYRVHYSVISLNPYVSSIYFVSDAQFTPLLKSCIDLGMTISAFSCRMDDNRVYIDKRLQIIFP